jgi:hypothetical protein
LTERFVDLKQALDNMLTECERLWRNFDGSSEQYRKIRLGLLIAAKYLSSLHVDQDVKQAQENKRLIAESQRKILELEAKLSEGKQETAP